MPPDTFISGSNCLYGKVEDVTERGAVGFYISSKYGLLVLETVKCLRAGGLIHQLGRIADTRLDLSWPARDMKLTLQARNLEFVR